MRLFLNDNEVTLGDLKQALGNLDYGLPDGGSFESMELFEISDDGDLYFEIVVNSTF